MASGSTTALLARLRIAGLIVATVGISVLLYLMPRGVATRSNPVVDSAKGVDRVEPAVDLARPEAIAEATGVPAKEVEATGAATGLTAAGAHSARPLSRADRRVLDSLHTLYRAAPSLSPGRLTLAKLIAARHEGAGQYDSAVRYRSEVVRIEPTPVHQMAAGEAAFNAYSTAADPARGGEFGRMAREYYAQVIIADPMALKAKTHMAMTWIGSETPMKGISLLREVLDQDPTDRQAGYHLGVLSMQTGQYQKAVERFERVLKHHPDDDQSRYFLALCFKNLGRNDQAREALEALIARTQDAETRASARDQLAQLPK